MQVFLQYSVFSFSCTNCTNCMGRISTSFRDLTLDINKVRVYNGHIKNEGGARNEAFCNDSESVEPYRCCCVRTGLLSCLHGFEGYRYDHGRCHSGCVHFCLPVCKPYRTGMACGAYYSCTCGTHYEPTEYGRKQKCIRQFRAAHGSIENKTLSGFAFCRAAIVLSIRPSADTKFDFMLCKTQLKNKKIAKR